MISKKTKYALNALVYLAKQEDNSPVLISDIAKSENIPQKFLETILLELKKAAILASKKGRGGGYYLLKEPKDVNLADVMRFIDGPIALLPCVSYLYYEKCDECHDEETCGIRDVFFEVRNKTVDLLKHATLEEIIRREKRKVE
ncbi:Rrf2 family transcriptional regulator [Reichenbachiella agarivorans]|uniref:Rrf2 family transcriptional regulator n=1 Tax=Reichenbachiella agarivorans TaxID=2979464 RepID=A0ABY6CMU1_9BACT|nr:Rrf2 family transcriptional regulator [Reichenbachiella agarivorans]UXP31797.1 Rrf2 family transcriptional regulator [Reichenbachiella agarivorans]